MKKKTYRESKRKNWLLLPIVLMMGLVPMLVHMFQYNANLSQFDWYPSNADTQADFFFAWKMIAIVLIAVIMAGILLYHAYRKEKFRFDNAFYFLFAYGLFVVMSALFSPHKYWVVRGTYELFEPVWVVLAYILMCYYTYHFVENEKQLSFVLKFSGIGIAVVTVIGTFQYFGLDFFQSEIGKHLITNASVWDNLESLSVGFLGHISYTTLYNPNFLSFYYGMLIPLIACLCIAAKKHWQRALGIFAEILCILCLIGSQSMTGWMALAIGAVIIVLVLLSRNRKAFIIGIVLTLIGIISAVVIGNTTAAGRTIRDTITGTYYMSEQFALSGVETSEEHVALDIWGNKLYLTYESTPDADTSVVCKDENGNVLKQTMIDSTNQIFVIDDTRFRDLQLQPVSFGEDLPGICVTIQGVSWNFVYAEGTGYLYVNPAGKAVRYPETKQSYLFKDNAMSDRGHIWDKTIPVLAKHIVMGSGANSYMFEVQQEDYISQNYVYGANSYDVKAHCWYLQQWVETGLIGTILLLIFVGWYLIQSIRLYRCMDLHNGRSWIGLGFFSAIVVYMIVAVANDSNVCTAPVFWCMLGLGFSVNRMNRKES